VIDCRITVQCAGWRQTLAHLPHHLVPRAAQFGHHLYGRVLIAFLAAVMVWAREVPPHGHGAPAQNVWAAGQPAAT
jgi:hypothetical protein